MSDAALTTRLNAARSAIGDFGEEQRLIKTLPRKGFRFVGAVHEGDRPSGTAAGLPSYVDSSKPELALPDKPSIAVLPFENMSGDPEQQYFADGMVEEITTALSQFKWLFVIARNSSFTFKGRAVDIKEVGRRLGVRYVLEGSVRKSSGKVRIAGQLIDAVTGAHIWADRFERDLTDVFTLQDEVAVAVVSAIEPKLLQTEIAMATRRRPENLTAYDLYLRALPHYYASTREGLAEAIRLAHSALELDPRFGFVAAWQVSATRSTLPWAMLLILNSTARKQFDFFGWHSVSTIVIQERWQTLLSSRPSWLAIVKARSRWRIGRSYSIRMHLRHGMAEAGCIELRGCRKKRSGTLNVPFA